jgi:mono/diheme cytochrome c family protein
MLSQAGGGGKAEAQAEGSSGVPARATLVAMRTRIWTLVAGAACASALPILAQEGLDLERASGAQIYGAACANCHGPDGSGLDRSLLAFEEELPDFTDCDFAAREPDGDWVAIAHQGGPIRGFSRMMPAFGGGLTPEQLQRVISHIRTFCTEPAWPAGELNLPRGLLIEKAYPEDEWVIEADADLEDAGAFGSAFIYERRFGPRSQFEVKLSYGWAPDPAGAPGDPRVSGFGDAVVAVKHALYHSAQSGTIFALAGEVSLPTGDERKGLGEDGLEVEAFASFGQIVASDGFVQAQVGAAAPLYDGSNNLGFARFGAGRTFTQGPWGRSWTPQVEVQARHGFGSTDPTTLDVVPQLQVSLNQRQHVLGSVGLLVPANARDGRSVRLLVYLLLDWFDGGFFEGW